MCVQLVAHTGKAVANLVDQMTEDIEDKKKNRTRIMPLLLNVYRRASLEKHLLSHVMVSL